MKALPITLAAALVATSGAAAAQTANDARCLLLSSAFAKQTQDANAQKLAEASFYFYLGRIAPQATAAQLKSLFDTQAKGLTDAAAPGLMNACAKEFQTKVEMLNSLAGNPPPASTPPKK